MDFGVYHTPVMCAEVAEYLINNLSGKYADCTLGGAGHSLYLLEKYPQISLIGLDSDKGAVEESKQKLSKYTGRTEIFRENFKDIRKILDKIGVSSVDGVLADLGVSSRQFDDAEKGFSFGSDTLDMRMDSRLEKNAADIINTYDFEGLTEIFLKYGEERFAGKISRRIIEERKEGRIESGKKLAEIVEKVKRREGPVHPATKIFQALRIAVNNELENLSVFLNDVPSVLSPGGRAVIISYHSLEDRIVKNSFRDKSRENIYKLLTKNVVFPSDQEVKANRRSRSAKLRAVERL